MVVLWGLGAALLFLGLVRYLEKTSLFYPSHEMLATPRDAGLSFEEIDFKSEDGVLLHGWFVLNPSARWNLLCFQGNASNMSGRIDRIAALHAMGFNILIFDYRGYGRTTGKPSEQGLYRDGRAAFDYLAARQDIGHLPIVLYGASLGGAVAIEVASHRKPAALIVEASFSNMRDMAARYYPFVPGFMLSLRFDSDRKVAAIRCPKLFIHSPQDDIVPFALGQKLFTAAAEPKAFLEARGGHNETFFESLEEIKTAVSAFLARSGV